MLEILEKSATKISTLRTGPRNGRPLSHCWTHGCSDNTSHTGATCTNKKEGHIEEATWENKMGGSEKYYSKKEWRLASISTLSPNNSKIINLNNTSTSNNISNVHVYALHTSSPLITDTAATYHFVEMNTSFLKNIKPADSPIYIVCPSGTPIHSTHITKFAFDDFPPH